MEPYLRGSNGREVARQLCTAAAGPICIAVTGGGLPEDRQRSRAAGIAIHLLKPAEPEALVALLAGVSRARPPAALAV